MSPLSFSSFLYLWGRLLPDTDTKVYYSNLASVLVCGLDYLTSTSIPGGQSTSPIKSSRGRSMWDCWGPPI